MGGLPSVSATLADRESPRDDPKRVEDFLKKVSKVFPDPEVYRRCFNFKIISLSISSAQLSAR